MPEEIDSNNPVLDQPENQKAAKHKGILLLLSVTFLILVVDQVTKWLVRSNLELGEQWMPLTWLAPLARFTYIKNTGAAFGLFQNANVILAVMAVLISIGVISYYYKVPDNEKLTKVALSMMLGGALGNLIDRVTIGYVTDFISLGTFAIFNVADSCITVGVGLLILSMWISENKEKKHAKELEEILSNHKYMD